MSAQHASLPSGSSSAGCDEAGSDGLQTILARREAWSPANFGPAVAIAIAELFKRYWQDARAHSELHPARAIDVIDLAPGNGFGGHQIIRALQAMTRHAADMRFRYLPVVPDDTWMSRAASAPPMAEYRRQGWLLPLLGAPDMPGQLMADGVPYECRNPVLVLVHDGWARLSQRLLAVHYGKLLEADLDRIGDNNTDKNERQDWRPADVGLQSGAFGPMFARYRDEFNSSPICYPEGALDALRRWRQFARHGYLMLAAGAGIASELRMRLHTFPNLISAYRDSGSLPVHYGLLGYWARLHGAATLEQDLPQGQAIQMVMEASDGSNERLASIAEGFDPAVFNRQNLMSETMRLVLGTRKLEPLRQLLQLSGHDPALLTDICHDLTLVFSKTIDWNRAGWRVALEETWANFLPELSEVRLHERLANAAMHCGHWPLAREALQRGVRCHGEKASDLANLAWCEMRTGQMAKALELVQRALDLDAENPIAQQVMQRLQERLKGRDDKWRVELHHAHLPLTLEPLDLSHAEAYFTQYRDPQIAIMTGLPQLKSIDETRQWINAEPSEVGRVSFAVMHHDHGFVAYVNLSVSGHAAFFCFWTGVDFQGQGFATAAARLVFRHAASMGVPLMLTSAYKDNRRSIRALERLGFRRMASQALPPDQDRIFFVLPDPSIGEVDAHQELVDYYRREALPLKFADETPETNSMQGFAGSEGGLEDLTATKSGQST